ncbi:MAG: F0F1 ATP synthase subunit A [Clostridia bacterium]|nr:F0F1 ATP synthase subunit A [Clostridia bacterium]
MWGLIVVLGLISFIATRNLKRIPEGKRQTIIEMVVDALLNFFSGVLGFERAHYFLPFLGTMFIFILASNYVGFIPGAGSIPGIDTPTANWSVTAGLALTVFVATQFYGIKRRGPAYLKGFFQPVFFMLPLNLVEQAVRPLSLSLRLFGNIYGGEMTAAALLSLVPYLLPVPIMFLSILFGFIQAVVFTLLSSVYFYEATHE